MARTIRSRLGWPASLGIALVAAGCANDPAALAPAAPAPDLAAAATSATTYTVDANLCGGFGVPGGGRDPVAEAPPGHKLVKVTLRSARAVCNDGSPAVIYVRAPAAPSSDWVIFLQGGSHCSNYNDCYDRWCGVKHDAAKMSSRWAPPKIGDGGIFADSQPGQMNAFAGYNQVYAYYCSSDQWSGDTTTTSTLNRPGSPAMPLYFRGRAIFDAMIAELSAGVRTSSGPQLPSLGGAHRVLLTGSSAGSDGVKHNLDHLAVDLLPGVEVRGVLDAGFGPVGDGLPLYITSQSERDAEELAAWNKVRDADCVAFHSSAGRSDAWRCADGVHVAMNHLTTPFFVRQDLQDSNVLDGRLDLPYAQLTWDALDAVGRLTQLAEDSTHPVPLAVTPGVFGPACQNHEGITQPGHFFDDFVVRSSATYHNALVDWLAGRPAFALDARPTVAGVQSTGCF